MKDYGTTIALDERTGDILEDMDGNATVFDGVSVMEQSINTLLQTQKGEEDLYPEYGIDWFHIFKNLFGVEILTLTKFIIMQGLVKESEPMIGEYVIVDTEWENEANGIMRIDVSIADLNGNVVSSKRYVRI